MVRFGDEKDKVEEIMFSSQMLMVILHSII